MSTEEEKDKPSRKWILVLNNYTDESSQELITFFSHGTVYACFAYEVGDSGTPHMQCYMYLHSACTFKQIKKYFVCQPHIEKAHGTALENRTYCCGPYVSPDGKKTKPLNPDFKEWGTLPAQGKRTDIDFCRTAFKKGMSFRDFANHASGYQALKTFQLLQPYQKPVFRKGVEIYWYWGESGMGKSRAAFEEAGDDYYVPLDLNWFEGYDGHAHVIIDEFRDSDCSWKRLLQLTDIYPLKVGMKGSSANFCAKKIWITSCMSPFDVYKNMNERRVQLLRRITRCEEFHIQNDIFGAPHYIRTEFNLLEIDQKCQDLNVKRL